MNCTEFREEYQKFLDTKERVRLPEGLLAHMNSCPACASYAAEMLGVDSALRDIPRVKIPPHLLASLKEMPETMREKREPTLSRNLVIRAIIVLTGLLIWIAGNFVPAEVQLLLNGFILGVGAFALTTNFLKPRFLNPVFDR